MGSFGDERNGNGQSHLLRTRYFELCHSQKSFLHHNLLKGLNCMLAAGMISKTVNIANAIRASKLSTSCDNFATWDKTLKGFEELGMNVGFLRARLTRLLSLASESREAIESRRLRKAQVEEEMRTLEARRFELEVMMKGVDAEIEALKIRGERLELMFHEGANARW